MHALLKEKSILVWSVFAVKASLTEKTRVLSCSVADWYLYHELTAWAALSALQSPWASLPETAPIASPKICHDLCHFVPVYVASHNRKMVGKLFPRDIKASVQTLCQHHLIQRKLFWCRLHRREGKSNSYSSGHHKNEVCLHRMKA